MFKESFFKVIYKQTINMIIFSNWKLMLGTQDFMFNKKYSVKMFYVPVTMVSDGDKTEYGVNLVLKEFTV